MNPKYEHILHREHHQSKSRRHMTLEERAAQFSPFAALVGYDDQIEDTNRFRQEQIELGESDLEELNEKIHSLLQTISKRPYIEIIYYHKEHEKYEEKCGNVFRINELQKVIEFKDGVKIDFYSILQINIPES